MKDVNSVPRSPSQTSIGHGKVHDLVDKENLDVAAEFLNGVSDVSYSAKEEKALRWRLDKRLIPLLWFNVTLGAVDKSTISTGAL